MTFTARGIGIGEIEVDIRKLGVKPNDEASLKRSIAAMKLVKDVSITDGVLKCKVRGAQSLGGRAETVIKRVHDSIVETAEHKVKVPGRGVERRQSYRNDRVTAQGSHH